MEKINTNESLNEIEIVQKSYGRCLAKGDMLQTFYDHFLNSSPVIAEKFKNTDFGNQKKLLKHGINLMIMYAAESFAGTSGLKRLRESHNRHHLNISPELYELWKSCLFEAVKEHDYQMNDEVMQTWDAVISKGIKYIASGY